jgi:hypothetical protein
MYGLVKIVAVLMRDALRWAVLLFRSPEAIQAENLLLRRQLALFMERGVQPRPIDAATRVSLTLRSRHFDWRAGRREASDAAALAPRGMALASGAATNQPTRTQPTLR